MNIFLALVIVAFYIMACIWGFKWYFYVQNLVKVSKFRVFLKNICNFMLFIIFICIEVPFAIFFPAWVNAKLMIIDENAGTTSSMLLFGCFVLIISVWKGKAYHPNNFS